MTDKLNAKKELVSAEELLEEMKIVQAKMIKSET